MKQFNLLKISSTLFILSLIFHQFSFLEIIKNVNIKNIRNNISDCINNFFILLSKQENKYHIFKM